MGAWIEISYKSGLSFASKVAPFMGAWIEILDVVFLRSVISVAPFMGAWIEIEQRRHGGQT